MPRLRARSKNLGLDPRRRRDAVAHRRLDLAHLQIRRMTSLFLIACAAGLYLAGVIIDMASYKRRLKSLVQTRWPRI